MFSCVTFSFSALPFERAVRLIALRELDRVDKARGEPLYGLLGGRVREPARLRHRQRGGLVPFAWVLVL